MIIDHYLYKKCAGVKTSIDLFSLYVLFFHFRPRDATRGNSLFQMSFYPRANVRITNEKKKQKENSHEGITWSEMKKQNVQVKKVYFEFLNLDFKRQLDFSLSENIMCDLHIHHSHKSNNTYHLLTESEVITGKSQTEALMY